MLNTASRTVLPMDGANESHCVGKEPCPECGSRDNLARYSDGHGYCFGCEHYEPADGEEPQSRTSAHRKEPMTFTPINGDIRPLRARGITEETCRKYDYRIGKNSAGQLVHVANYRDADSGQLCGQHTRDESKEFKVLGDITKNAGLFGQHLFSGGGRLVVVCEGEIDALTVSQCQGNKWPVVSVPNGALAAKKAIARQLQWLCGYETVVLMFDMDPQGREAAIECAKLFPPSKCSIATLTMKDPNELLMAGRPDEIIQAIWNAKPYRPDGIVSFGEMKASVLEDLEIGLPWCLDGITELTHGRRYTELYGFGAGTGVGKTDLLTQQLEYDLNTLGLKVGAFFLETPIRELSRRIAGKMKGKRFHIPNGGWTREELSTALDQMDTGQLFLYDNFGACDWETIKGLIRHLHHADGVRVFYLDHLTALAAMEDDEKKALEQIMAELAGIAKELEIIIHYVSHLSTPEGKSHEEGGRVAIKHFKGSRAIGFWSHYMFGLERDQQAENEADRQSTTFRILKARYDGSKTGRTIGLGYCEVTGRLFEQAMNSSPFEDHSAF